MILSMYHDNVDTFDLFLTDTKKKRVSVHIVFEKGITYDVSPEFIKNWLPTHGMRPTLDEAQRLSDELTQHIKKLNELEENLNGCNG